MPDTQPSVVSGALAQPFAEQAAFFRNKLGNRVPTARWDEVWKSAHDSAFMVAGAAKADLLADLAAAVDKAIVGGAGLQAFRQDFRAIVARRGWHGWKGEGTRGGEAWRTRVIYTTNAATSYAAGRLAQLRAGGFDLWVYRHNDSVLYPRPQHLAWNGLTLPAGHPFWETHYPPNGWGCRCAVSGARSQGDAKLLGGDPDKHYDTAWDAYNPKTGEPIGIDRGWGYMPGANVNQDVARAVAAKTIAWPYEIAKAYMAQAPAPLLDSLALAQRSLPSTAEAARRYAGRALGSRNGAPISGPVEVQPYQTLGLLTTAELSRLREHPNVAGLDGPFDWTLAADEVRHIMRRHGDAKREAAMGQIAITAADFEVAGRALRAGGWIPDGQTDVGVPAIAHTFEEGGERYHLIWEIRTGRRMVVLKSMRKRPAPEAVRP